jgi:hypothetical protein
MYPYVPYILHKNVWVEKQTNPLSTFLWVKLVHLLLKTILAQGPATMAGQGARFNPLFSTKRQRGPLVPHVGLMMTMMMTTMMMMSIMMMTMKMMMMTMRMMRMRMISIMEM